MIGEQQNWAWCIERRNVVRLKIIKQPQQPVQEGFHGGRLMEQRLLGLFRPVGKTVAIKLSAWRLLNQRQDSAKPGSAWEILASPTAFAFPQSKDNQKPNSALRCSAVGRGSFFFRMAPWPAPLTRLD